MGALPEVLLVPLQTDYSMHPHPTRSAEIHSYVCISAGDPACVAERATQPLRKQIEAPIHPTHGPLAMSDMPELHIEANPLRGYKYKLLSDLECQGIMQFGLMGWRLTPHCIIYPPNIFTP